jgi:hypothetical protein
MAHRIATVRCVAVAWSWGRERGCSSRKLLIAGCARPREGRGRTIGPSCTSEPPPSPRFAAPRLEGNTQKPTSQSAKAGLGLGPSPAVGEPMAEQCSNSWRSSINSSSLVVKSDEADAGHKFMSRRPCLQMRSRRDQGGKGWCPWIPLHRWRLQQPHATRAASPLLSCDPSPYSIKCPTWDWEYLRSRGVRQEFPNFKVRVFFKELQIITVITLSIKLPLPCLDVNQGPLSVRKN